MTDVWYYMELAIGIVAGGFLLYLAFCFVMRYAEQDAQND